MVTGKLPGLLPPEEKVHLFNYLPFYYSFLRCDSFSFQERAIRLCLYLQVALEGNAALSLPPLLNWVPASLLSRNRSDQLDSLSASYRATVQTEGF